MEIHFKRDNGPLDEAIREVLALAGGIRRPEIIREMIIASLKAGQEDDGGVNLKLMHASAKEMRFTAKAFSPYRDVRKVTVFGSARTRADETAYRMARLLGRKLAESGYMVITGGGPGIMQAVHEGAGPQASFGVNIRLPFEQKANPVMEGDTKNITYKYFFNRKVAFLKECDAIALFPGGFGTLDEGMEALTLVQTGKRNPVPILLVDEPKGTYWKRLAELIEKSLLAGAYISPFDLALFERVESVDDVVGRIKRFYFRYHSLRYLRDALVVRLTSPIRPEKVEELRIRFSNMLRPAGTMFLSGALPEEADEPAIAHLPRLVLDFNRRDFGRLRQFIDAVNSD
ncbi:MAG: TIGR00730 family Rossman fold protein [Deltaproteobacteria bacterium]|nr:TIGR00730 family Rossman fold protein [Deltaproteobacteria bacterium]